MGLEKLAEIYDILKGRRGHSHFIDRGTYDDLLSQHQRLEEKWEEKCNEIEELNIDLSLLKEQINMMKGTLGDKLEETATMNDKIQRAEKKLGSRLSQVDLSSVKQQLEKEQNKEIQQKYKVPDYSKSTNTKHRKQRSSTTLELDQLNDDFSDIAKNVQAYGAKDVAVSGPTHYRKFSNTTKQIMEQHKNAGVPIGGYSNMNGRKNKGHRARDSMKIGDIVDDDGIDFESDHEQKLERESNDEDIEEEEEERNKNKNKKHRSRESRQLDDDEVNVSDYFEEEEEEYLGDIEQKRKPKTRKSRESRQLDDYEIVQKQPKSRKSRESRQLDDFEIHSEDEQVDDVSFKPPVKKNKARGSFQMEAAVLSSAVLETHNEHHLEQEAAEINGPKDHQQKHKKSDTMTSDSTAYRAFMSVD